MIPVHPLCALSPDMPADLFAEFKADIQANGQREPVKIWNGQLIDGRHRQQACHELGIDPLAVVVQLEENALPLYVLSLNAMRNHLSVSQRTIYAATIANRNRGQPGQDRLITKLSNYVPPTIEQAAKAMRVAPSQVIKAKKILRDGAPEVALAVRRGDLSVHAAKQIVDTLPKQDQPAAVERWVASPVKKFRKVVPVTGGKVHSPPRRKEPIEDLVDRAVTNLDVASQALATYGDRTKPTPGQRASWETILERAAKIIRRFGAHLKEAAA